MDHFPIFLALQDCSGLVVGAKSAAAGKVRPLIAAGARVTVVAPEIGEEIARLAGDRELEVVARGFETGDVAARSVVFSATGIGEVDERVAGAARAGGVPVNVVDRPDLCTFIMPAIVDRGPVVVAVSSGGAAPVLARRIRAAIEGQLPAGLGRLARFAGAFRDAVRGNISGATARRRFWERFFVGPAAEAVLAGDEHRAREAMLKLVNRPDPDRHSAGAVYIVGAGPGDPDLLTFRALRLMQQADVVVYDRLIGPRILDYVRRDAERVPVGKSKGNHTLPQEEINALIAHHAEAGRRVVRLKGGDPFVFGRGGEEVEYVRNRGIQVQTVPGITATAGCAAAAGIPLTHRDHAGAVTFVSGHSKTGDPDLDWAALARPGQTLAIYMGTSTAGTVSQRLIEHGIDPATPAAIIENGTRPDQRVVVGSLAELGNMVADMAVCGPALIIIGEVVGLAKTTSRAEPTRAVAV